jgi:hypothetical protein
MSQSVGEIDSVGLTVGDDDGDVLEASLGDPLGASLGEGDGKLIGGMP